jgi:RNA polymerase sigma-70 factor (ECF subfamily)
MTSDEALMLQFRGGRRAAFDELFARHRDAVYGFFRRRVAVRERAEDLTQETFLAVLRGAERWEPRSAVRSYLFGIAFKVLSADRRKSGRETEDGAEPWGSDHTEESLWVRHALGKLEAAEREILMLREYEQLSYEEVGAVLRIPVNTVRSRLFRARMALRSHLEPSGKETRHA